MVPVEGVAIARVLGVAEEEERQDLDGESRIRIGLIRQNIRQRVRVESEPQTDAESQTETGTEFRRILHEIRADFG